MSIRYDVELYFVLQQGIKLFENIYILGIFTEMPYGNPLAYK